MNRRLIRYRFQRLKLNAPQFVTALSTAWALLRWKLFRRYRAADTPLALMIEPTNRCNFNCPLCDRGTGKLTRPEGSMSLEDFERILEGAGRGLKLLLLWNQGEPLLNKQFGEMARAAKRRGVFCAASTNGSLLRRKAEEILDSGLDELIVSLDGATAESYNRYRRGGDFEDILNGIRHLVEKRGKRLAPLISLQFLLLKDNIGEIEDFKRLVKNLGADRALWKTVQVSDETQAAEFLPQDAAYSRYRNPLNRELKRTRRDCRRLLYSAVVDWNGNMVPCCFDKDEAFVVGNALESDFKSVWKGAKFNSFRAKIAEGRLPAMCHNCTEGIEQLFVK